MPKPLLIKPIIKAVKKATGININELQAVDLMRGKFVKAGRKAIKEHLGVNTKVFNQMIDAVGATPARKAAVKGRNYVKNLNRFLDDPVDAIYQYGKRKVKAKAHGLLDDFFEDEREDSQAVINRRALDMLQGTLFSFNPMSAEEFKLPRKLWHRAGQLDYDTIMEEVYKLEKTNFYHGAEEQSEHDRTYAKSGEHAGYKQGLTARELVRKIVSMIDTGHYSEPHDGRI